MHERPRALVNESTAVRFHMIYSHFNTKAEEAKAKAWLSNTNESARGMNTSNNLLTQNAQM
jgi:hypothetical protein